MRSYTWDEYYEKFYDWAESTQVRNLSYLTDLGDADEVAEIITELSNNASAANRLLKKAVEAGLQFSGDDLMEIFYDCDRQLAEKALMQSGPRLQTEDLSNLYDVADDEILLDVCRKYKLPVPDELKDEEDEEDDDEEEDWQPLPSFYTEVPRPPEKPGFFLSLAAGIAALAGIDLLEKRRSRHHGSCTGDCAHCPDHYGYRYGRWYYGKGHDHGCEFGGNKGGGL